MQTQSRKILFYSDVNMELKYEWFDGIPLLHCDVKKISPSILRGWYSVFKTFTEMVKEQGVTTIATVSPNPKFAELFGGDRTGDIVKYENKDYEVVVWELK